MHRPLPFVLFSGLLPLILTGCHGSYSPNTYASTAAQQEAAVQRGMIIGVRQVLISASGTVGAATGGAAGGVAGSQIGSGPVGTALGAIGGTLVGGIGGAAAAQAVGNTKGWEYIVQEAGEKLVSVTQTSKAPLPVGLHVLVISDSQQARIVPDYTVQVPAAPPAQATASGAVKPAGAPDGSAAFEVNIGSVLPAANPTEALQVVPITAAGDPATPAAASPDSAAAATTPAVPAASTPVDNPSPAAPTNSPAPAASPVPVVPNAPVAPPAGAAAAGVKP